MNHRLLIQATRLSLYLIVVALTILNHVLQDNFFNWSLFLSFYSFAILGLTLHLIPVFNLDKFFEKRRLVFASFLLDIVLISSLLITSGLNQTLFLFMYLVTIILSGLVFHSRGSLLMAALASIGFTVGSWFGPEIKAMSFLFILILNNLAFFVVAGISGYLSDQLSLFAEKLEAQNLSLTAIRRINEMIVETIPSGLMTINSSNEILQYNPSAAQLFQNENLEGVKLFQLVPELSGRKIQLNQMKTGEKHEVRWEMNSESYLLGIHILPQTLSFDTSTFLVVIEDLTQVRRLEFAVRQSEKLAAVGQLAAGIAHEIRNPLAGISGSVELLSQNFSTDDDKKLAKIILREIDRLNRLISEFLDFAKPEKPPGEMLDLNSILKEVVENAMANQQKRTAIETVFTERGFVLGHPDKLKQAFLNIVINGLQAMQEKNEGALKVSTVKDGERILVKIKDQGCGMTADIQKRMFEPFHTTKPKGTGLGLAITHKILEAHSAQIFVESQVGLGTEFVISFPAKSIEN
jgi:two-component system sensor histidine kinase PilS (NtrC family)